MAMSKAEQDSLEALRSGATLAEAVALLPDLTVEQMALLNENGDFVHSLKSSLYTPVGIDATSAGVALALINGRYKLGRGLGLSEMAHRRSRNDARISNSLSVVMIGLRLASAVSPRTHRYQRLLSSFSCSRSICLSSRSCVRIPPLQALREARDLPSTLTGPVLCSHGFHCCISSAWRARRSGVQPFAIFNPQ